MEGRSLKRFEEERAWVEKAAEREPRLPRRELLLEVLDEKTS